MAWLRLWQLLWTFANRSDPVTYPGGADLFTLTIPVSIWVRNRGQHTQSSLEVGNRSVRLLFQSRDEQTFDRNRTDPSEVKQIGQAWCQKIVNRSYSIFQFRKPTMFDFPKSNIGHVRFSKIENRPYSIFPNRTSAMFDFPKSKIGHVWFPQIESRPCPTPHNRKTTSFDATDQ